MRFFQALLFPPPPPAAPRVLSIDGLAVQLTRKPIRTLTLRLKPPEGSVHVSAPLRLAEARIVAFVRERRGWITRHQQRLAALPPAHPRGYADGDRLQVLGREVRVQRLPGRRAQARLAGDLLQLRGPAGEAAVQRCLAAQLLKEAQALLPARVAALGVETPTLRVRRMRSRWGTCAIRTKVVTLALELAWREPRFLDYILVHELAHLRVRTHGPRFKAILDKQIPQWRQLRRDLEAGGALNA